LTVIWIIRERNIVSNCMKKVTLAYVRLKQDGKCTGYRRVTVFIRLLGIFATLGYFLLWMNCVAHKKHQFILG